MALSARIAFKSHRDVTNPFKNQCFRHAVEKLFNTESHRIAQTQCGMTDRTNCEEPRTCPYNHTKKR